MVPDGKPAPGSMGLSRRSANGERDDDQSLRRVGDRRSGRHVLRTADAQEVPGRASVSRHGSLGSDQPLLVLQGPPRVMTWDSGSLTRTGNRRTTRLSRAELEVMRSVAARYPRQQIADQRSVTIHTVRNQLANAYRKLGVTSRTEAIRALDEKSPGWRA